MNNGNGGREYKGLTIGNSVVGWITSLFGAWSAHEVGKIQAQNPSHNYTYDYGGEKSFNIIWILVIVLGFGFIFLLLGREKKK